MPSAVFANTTFMDKWHVGLDLLIGATLKELDKEERALIIKWLVCAIMALTRNVLSIL